MRKLPALLLAVLVALSPVAQASACVCGTPVPSEAAECCCPGHDGACHCCCGGGEEQERPLVAGGCSCEQTAPRAPGAASPVPLPPESLELPVAAAPAPRRPAVFAEAPGWRDPHPGVLLPLLI